MSLSKYPCRDAGAVWLDAAVPADVDLRQALQSMTQDPITHVEGGIVSESTESALIYPAVGGMKLAAHPPLRMRKEGKVWKVDLAAMSDEPRYSPEVGRRYRAAGKALSDAARQIRAGRYPTLADAEQAVAQNMDFEPSQPSVRDVGPGR